MKFFPTTVIIPSLLAVLIVVTRSSLVDAKERLGPEVGGAGDYTVDEKFDPRNGGATDNRNPLMDLNGRNHDPSCGGDSMHHQHPCEIDVDSPVLIAPTDPPVVDGRFTIAPSEVPATESPTVFQTSETTSMTTSAPTVESVPSPTAAVSPPVSESNPTIAPTVAPLEPCVSTDGTFGVVSGTADTDVQVNYMYEMETAAGVTPSTIDSVILPQLEKAIVDSVLAQVFPNGCAGVEFGKLRHLRAERRLTVTGITMNPSDLINEEFACDSSTITDSVNGCNVIDGQLTLYTTDGQASQVTEAIQKLIRENMNTGAYNEVNDDIVRLVYLDATPNSPESNTEDGNTGNDNTDTNTSGSNDLRVGLFVGLFVGAAIFAGVLYRTRRNRHVDDETDIQTANGASAIQSQAPSQSFMDAGVLSQDESVMSYDDSGMVMADTGMDSESLDGLGIAT